MFIIAYFSIYSIIKRRIKKCVYKGKNLDLLQYAIKGNERC